MISKIAFDAVKKFKSGINKGNFKKSNANDLDVSNTNIFQDAVYSAYLDASRTFTGIGSKKDPALKKLAESIQSYFKGNAYTQIKDYDRFHDKLCLDFIKKLKSAGYDATYGQAQKIINMTFKYLYCLDNAIESYDDYFKFCHIALDTFTLEWIWRKCRPSYTNKVRKYEAWSNLEKSDYKDSNGTKRPGYDTIVSIYRKCFQDDSIFKGCTPFQAEFIFWPEIQLELSAEQFLIQLEEADKSRTAEIKRMSLEDKKTTIKNILAKNSIKQTGEFDMENKKSPLIVYREKISEIHTPEEIKEAFNSNNVICFGIREGYRGKRNLLSMIWEINPEAIIIVVDLCVFHSEPTVYCKRILVIDRNGNKESGNSILGCLHDSEGIVDCYVSFKENNCGIKRCILQTFDDKPKAVQKMNLLFDGEDMLVTVRHLNRANHEKMKVEEN